MSINNIADILAEIKHKHGISPTMTKEEWQQEKINRYNNSEGDMNEQDGYNCRLCKNKGMIARIDEQGNEVYTLCKCRKIREMLKRAKRSGLGDVIRDCTFDKFETAEQWQKEIKSKAQAFCKDDNANWFYIGGQVGAGKSHICTAIAAYYIKAGKEVRYMIWAEEAKRLKAIVNDSSYAEMIHRYKDVDVLYIDDFLKVKFGETPTAADINLAFEIINHRLLSNDKITIISSEKRLDEIMEYDEATMSRIYKETGAYKINIGKDINKNYRLKG